MSSSSAIGGRIAEIFFSIQGEGPTAGLPAVFIRLQGCSVGCQWCDTKYSWDPAAGRAVDLDGLMSQARSYPCRRVVITGGEPLESSLFYPLVTALQNEQFEIEVETSGTVEPPVRSGREIQWNVSVKLAASGVEEGRRINPAAIRRFLEYHAWWKFVVAGEDGSRRGAPPGRALRAAPRAHPAPTRGPPAGRADRALAVGDRGLQAPWLPLLPEAARHDLGRAARV